MIRVQVQVFLSLRNVIGQREVDLEIQNAKVRSVLSELHNRYGDRIQPPLIDSKTKEVNPYYLMLVNGRDLRNLPDHLDGELKEGDVVQLFPPAAGG